MQPNNQPSKAMDIKSPTQSTPTPPSQGLGQTEITTGIEVREMSFAGGPVTAPAQSANNPISSQDIRPITSGINEDTELDKVLSDVNSDVKSAVIDNVKPSGVIAKSQDQIKKAKNQTKKIKHASPRLIITVAVLFAIGLAVLAVYAYKQNQKNDRLAKAHLAALENAKDQAAQAAQAAQQNVFGAAYLTNFANSLTDNSSQDFDANSLSDTNLGL